MSLPHPRLAGRLALVTGASSGIGHATAVGLAREGATVIASARRAAALDALVKACAGLPGAIRPVAGDLADTGFVTALAGEARDADILCANAGNATYAPFLEITAEQVEAMFRVNVVSTTHLLQAVGRSMAARKSGHVVVMTSIAAREIYLFGSVYAASKHALSAIVQSMRLELKRDRIKVTEVRTGTVDTPMNESYTHPAVVKSRAKRTVVPLTAGEVADAVIGALTAGPNVAIDLIELMPHQV